MLVSDVRKHEKVECRLSPKVRIIKYTAQLKFSTDFNMMPHFEKIRNILFDVINIYGAFEITFFRVHQTKGNLVRRQWIDVKFEVMDMYRIHVYIENLNV